MSGLTNTELKLDPPDPAKPPVLSNVFLATRCANTTLAPLFPYAKDGDFVAGLSVFIGGEGRDPKAFRHKNSVDEVGIVFAASGSRLSAGDVIVGAREHVVSSIFENPNDPGAYAVMVIVQRHADEGVEQCETMTFMCEKCQTTLVEHEFDAKGTHDRSELDGRYPAFGTILQSYAAIARYNAEPGRRVCPNCGLHNEPFPVEVWGWERYSQSYEAATRAEIQFNEAGKVE